MKPFYVYILCSKRNGTLYIGVTSDLVEGFTKKYKVHQLIWFEEHPSPETAIIREKQLKKWNRGWKLKLIEKSNPEWIDLYDKVCT
jgi:putative endonuclease